MFKKHSKRSNNPIFVIFRLILSLSMFALLLFGSYSAYKHFSGLDPLKLDPQALISKLKLPTSLPANIIPPSSEETKKESSKALFSFLLVADIHNDNKNLSKAISQTKSNYSNLAFIIGLGDYTEIGTLNELREAKKVLDSSSLRYFVLPGDHDLWESRDKQMDPRNNFRTVFGVSYQSFNFQNYKFILIDNSDNYKGIEKAQSEWITLELENSKKEGVVGILAFMHEPLYHPSSDRSMGKVEKSLKTQAEALIYELKQAGVKGIFTGDIHYYSEYNEPVTSISMFTIGALVTDRNPQLPRYAIVTIYEDGSLKVDDTALK